ncbi:MAG TPA: hypothetical protein VHN99_06310, partial [Deinococcales bacterium]|nr:hypothetical protein [Deinococcales bacterium]
FQGRYFRLSDAQLARLLEAVDGHTRGRLSADPTVGTCWDADRLDLMRVGRRPDPRFLSTEAARRPDLIDWAAGLSS